MNRDALLRRLRGRREPWDIAVVGGGETGIGLKVYDLLAGQCGFGRSQWLSPNEVLERIPTLERAGLRGGALYRDAQFDDSRRLANLARIAAELHRDEACEQNQPAQFKEIAAAYVANPDGDAFIPPPPRTLLRLPRSSERLRDEAKRTEHNPPPNP